jgi:DNA-binding Xre family transcriptional regulator
MFQIRVEYSIQGVQNLLRRLMDEFGLAEYELATRSGVRPATIYGILATGENRQVRRSTLRRIAESLGCKVSFTEKTITVTQLEHHPRERNRLTRLAEEVANIIMASGKEDIQKDEAERLKDVVKVMMR